MKVDAHQHFWRIEDGIYDWIDDSISGIRRDFQLSHLLPYLDHHGIDKTILVQAAEDVRENDCMLAIAESSERIGGIIAWVDLMQDLSETFQSFAADHKIIKGIRPVLQAIEDNNWILQETPMQNLAKLTPNGLHFEALIQPRHLNTIHELATQLPDLTIVINHAAKPIFDDAGKTTSDWFKGMEKLAGCANVSCKLSGLASEFGVGWSANALQEVASHLVNIFGPNRLMWGSDWPVLELDGSYSQWHTASEQLLAQYSDADRAKIFGETAKKFYRI